MLMTSIKEFAILLRLYLLQFKNRLRDFKEKRIFSTIILGGISFFFLLMLYYGFWRLLNYLNSVPLLGPSLIFKFMSMVFLIFGAMLIFSNIISAFSTLYFSSDMTLLFSSPLNFGSIFSLKFFQNLLYSSWMVMVAFLPFILAYGKVYRVGLDFYLWVFLLLFPFILISGVIGVLFAMLIIFLFPTKRVRDIFLILGVLIFGGIFIAVRFIRPENLLHPDALDTVTQYLDLINKPSSPYLPNWWIVRGINYARMGNAVNYIFMFLLMASIALALFLLAIYIANRIFYKSWSAVQAGEGGRKKKDYISKIIKVFFPRPKNSFPILVEKDIKHFFRETTQWGQLLILGALIVVYLFNIHALPLGDLPLLKNLISFLNIVMVGFVLSAVALRFVFPAVSLEGKSFWIIKSSPIRIKALLWEKFWTGLLPLGILASLLIIASNLLLSVDRVIFLVSFFTTILITVGLVSMAVGMGAIYPRFNTENVAQIQSSWGGILYMIFSLFYIGLIFVIEAGPMRHYFQSVLRYRGNFTWAGFPTSMIFLLIINIIVFFLPMRLGEKRLERYEE